MVSNQPTYMEFKVILVDDDAVVLFLHQVLIKRSNLPPVSHSFKNGQEALDYILSSDVNEVPYLVLLDINMPVMNGWEFLDSVQHKSFRDNIFVAIVTSSINSHDLTTAKKYPQFLTYLEKPLSLEDLNKLKLKLESLLLKEK